VKMPYIDIDGLQQFFFSIEQEYILEFLFIFSACSTRAFHTYKWGRFTSTFATKRGLLGYVCSLYQCILFIYLYIDDIHMYVSTGMVLSVTHFLTPFASVT